MTTLKTRRMERGDVPFGKQLRAFATGGEAALQSVHYTLQMQKGEWFADPEKGIDYIGEVLDKKTPSVVASSILQAAIAQTNGVQAITRFEFVTNAQTRRSSISAFVKTADGFESYEGILPWQ